MRRLIVCVGMACWVGQSAVGQGVSAGADASAVSAVSAVSSGRANRGNDPFFQVSQAVTACPVPLGPLETEAQWVREGHWRIERGNSCWWEGRCRLSNGYLYDKEIEEAVRRRLNNIEPATHWREQTSLWLVLQRRFIYVQGCVDAGFDKARFIAELTKTADVERVIDETTSDPSPAHVPYRTAAEPDRDPPTSGD